MSWLWRGGEGPKDIPSWAHTYLVVFLGADPDRLNLLKCVEQIDYLETSPVTLIRIFDPASSSRAATKDFASLDQHPDLILYEGYRKIQGGDIEIFSLNEPPE
jgi:hypothetical protein